MPGLALFRLSDLNATINHEPRVSHAVAANRLGTRPQETARLIERNKVELETYGEVCVTATQTTAKGGRPGVAYWLNEGQALVLCALSRTPKAAEVRRALIEVFMAWRRGQIEAEARKALPAPGALDPGIAKKLRDRERRRMVNQAAHAVAMAVYRRERDRLLNLTAGVLALAPPALRPSTAGPFKDVVLAAVPVYDAIAALQAVCDRHNLAGTRDLSKRVAAAVNDAETAAAAADLGIPPLLGSGS